MDEDVLKGKWNEIKGRSKRSGANSPMTTSPWWKGKKRNSWGCPPWGKLTKEESL
jgi:hypothetical protein